MPKYCLEEYVSPIWAGNMMRYETVFFVGDEDSAELLYTPTKVLAVYDYSLLKEYKEGVDYFVKGKKIYRLKDGNLPYMPEEEYFLPAYIEHQICVNETAIPKGMSAPRFFAYGEEDTFTKHQIAVTYEYDEKENLPQPNSNKQGFSRFLEKCRKGEDVTLLFYGDSITTGCNASGTEDGGRVPPYAVGFAEMVRDTIAKSFHVNVEMINTAVGGWLVENGLQAVDERVKPYAADIMVLGFGMNNGHTPPEEFRKCTEEIILSYREKNPEGEVVLLSTTLPNVDSNWLHNHPLFANELHILAEKYPFCEVADMTEWHKMLLKNGKRWRDMTGNNINHPNDFLIRVYAQVILKTILNDEF